jgi:hypothetical protein
VGTDRIGRAGAGTSGWFARVGRPWLPADAAAVDALVASWPALAGATVIAVAGAETAAALLRAAVFDDAWWDEEEGLREGLWAAAARTTTELELERRLAADGARWRAVARDAAGRAFGADAELAADAAVALALAAHQRTLAALAGAGDDHVFARKLALFAAGRWPLGCHGGRFHVF